MKTRRPERHSVRYIAGVKFVAGGDGHYYSEDGRYSVFHMLRGTPQASWELYETIGADLYGDLIDDAMTLGEIVIHGKNGRITLAASAP
jgi:hypothetical protein